jgi:hypothetical protein
MKENLHVAWSLAAVPGEQCIWNTVPSVSPLVCISMGFSYLAVMEF